MNGSNDYYQESFESMVVGCFYYHGVVGRYVGESLKLIREPKNTHDTNAIAVLSNDGRILGHLSRSTASWFARELDCGTTASVTITKVIDGSVSSGSGRQSKHPPRLYVRVSRLRKNQMHGDVRLNHRNGEQNKNDGKTKKNDACFIVTAAFGSETDPMVCLFRLWRDQTLFVVPGGKLLIRFYSIFGPIGAMVLERFPCLKYPTRRGLILVYSLMCRFPRSGYLNNFNDKN